MGVISWKVAVAKSPPDPVAVIVYEPVGAPTINDPVRMPFEIEQAGEVTAVLPVMVQVVSVV